MSLLVRFIRFVHHEGWWLGIFVALLTIFAWRYPSRNSLITLFSTCCVALVVPYLIRKTVIRNYPRCRSCLNAWVYVVVASFLATRLLGHAEFISFLFVVYFATCLGAMFWAVSDPMFEMVTWLAFPTEYGRQPDEIHLHDARYVEWPGSDTSVWANLFRYRYDDTWDYGITGPITFALGDQDFDGKSPEEIYAAYRAWYEAEGIDKIVDETVKRDA